MNTQLFVAIILATLSFVTISCGLTIGPRPTPTPTPTPMLVELCYDLLLKQREENVTRLEAIKGAEFRCEGVITEITDDGRVQFHIKKSNFAEDQYVECEFSRIEEVRRLKEGAFVAFKGILDEAFPNRIPLVGSAGKNSAVKFKDCTLI